MVRRRYKDEGQEGNESENAMVKKRKRKKALTDPSS